MAERAYIAIELEAARTELPGLRVVQTDPIPPKTKPRQSGREEAILVLFSVLLHTGVAFGFLAQEKTPPARRVSKVDIEFSRPVEPPKPKALPPPLPPAAKAAQPVVAAKATPAPAETPPPVTDAPVAEEPVDSGSSAEAADDGNLFAGKGGTGTAPPAPRAIDPPALVPAKKPVVAAHEGANYSKNPRPGYPTRALREGWQGQVLVRVQVLPSGRPGILKVQKSAGFSVLDEAALAAIKGWSFVPARQGGQAVGGWVTVPIVFRLQ